MLRMFELLRPKHSSSNNLVASGGAILIFFYKPPSVGSAADLLVPAKRDESTSPEVALPAVSSFKRILPNLASTKPYLDQTASSRCR
jgi:hypothetical protein